MSRYVRLTLGPRQAEAFLAAASRGIDELESELGDLECEREDTGDAPRAREELRRREQLDAANAAYRKLYAATRGGDR